MYFGFILYKGNCLVCHRFLLFCSTSNREDEVTFHIDRFMEHRFSPPLRFYASQSLSLPPLMSLLPYSHSANKTRSTFMPILWDVKKYLRVNVPTVLICRLPLFTAFSHECACVCVRECVRACVRAWAQSGYYWHAVTSITYSISEMTNHHIEECCSCCTNVIETITS